MGVPYAEVIGDPIDHSKSPSIHKFWLGKLGVEGDYRPVRMTARELAAYLAKRCSDPYWRGCNVTAPLKERAAKLASDPFGICRAIGSANTIYRSPLGCGIGANTDIQGIAAALGKPAKLDHRACVIGAGGAARAVLHYLRAMGIRNVSMVARDVAKARLIHERAGAGGGVHSFEDCASALEGAEWVVNATPLGMLGQPPMPHQVLEALGGTGDDALIFDMVYTPVETPLLQRARQLGRRTSDGLTMLVAQAAPAFELFFGQPAPRQYDDELRELLSR